jgi:hypothetical protein
MGGRYGKYGEIKRLARLRKRTVDMALRARGGKNPLETRRHKKVLLHLKGAKG